MAEFKLHCFAQSGNAYKVALMLSLSHADWEPIFVDYLAGATKNDAWRSSVNEMGEIPVLEHVGRKLTQSGVILDYLAETTGQFAASSAEEQREIWRWILFDNHKFTSFFATHRWLRSFAKQSPAPQVMTFLRTRIDDAFGVVERHLTTHSFIVGDRPTIADFSLAGYLYYPSEETGYALPDSYPCIAAWTGRLMAQPGWRHPYDMMPGKITPRPTRE